MLTQTAAPQKMAAATSEGQSFLAHRAQVPHRQQGWAPSQVGDTQLTGMCPDAARPHHRQQTYKHAPFFFFFFFPKQSGRK